MGSDRVIEEIKQRLDLVDYIGRTVELKRAGRTYKACCPFHVENTPSFVVFPHTGTWHCFGGCGEGGDLFSYVQKREGLSFSEALQLLAREAGVTLEEESNRQREARDERERLLELCSAAAQQYQLWLRDLPEAQSCRDYIARRGISADAVQRFALGYAPNSWDRLLIALTERGYSAQDMALVGLSRERDSGGYYDTLRDRLVFPIRDVRGRVIGFGGRALHAEQTPKYLNSPQTPLFDKGRTLYAIELAKDAIRTQERAVIVEGYMDALAAHQAGFANVVASLGTALTSEQIKLLNRYSPNITLALDADSAGQKAAERGLEAVLNLQRETRRARWERARQGQGRATDVEGDIRVLTLPEGLDPDDLLRQMPGEWERLVADALPVVDYLIAQRIRSLDLEDPVQKARVASELLPVIADIESTIVRDHYLQRLARLLHTDERTLTQEMVKQAGRRRPADSGRQPTAQRERPRARRQNPPPPPITLPGDEAQAAEYEPSGHDLTPPPPPPEDDSWDAPPPDEAWLDEQEWQERADDGAVESTSEEEPGAEPRTLDAYLLYLLLERPAFIATAIEREVSPSMWDRTEERQIFEALLRNAPESAAHLEEFAEELEPPVARHLRRIVSFYAAQPAVEADDWEMEALTKLDEFLIAFEQRQARQLHYLLDDLQRTLEADPQSLRTLLQQKGALERNILTRQRRLHARAAGRKNGDTQQTPNG